MQYWSLNVGSLRMKIFILTLGVLLTWAPGSAQAIDWTTTNQVTLGWTKVSKLASGGAIPASDVISYEVWIVTEAGDKNLDKVFIESTGETQILLTFVQEGRYFTGVNAVRTKPDSSVSSSTISWSDNPEVVLSGIAFGIVYLEAPSGVFGMEVVDNAD